MFFEWLLNRVAFLLDGFNLYHWETGTCTKPRLRGRYAFSPLSKSVPETALWKTSPADQKMRPIGEPWLGFLADLDRALESPVIRNYGLISQSLLKRPNSRFESGWKNSLSRHDIAKAPGQDLTPLSPTGG